VIVILFSVSHFIYFVSGILYVSAYHNRFLHQNQVLIVCMTQDQLFHTYGQKGSQITNCHEIKYDYYYINSVSKDYDDSRWNGTAEYSITLQERQPGQHVA
jgi:hypothetical protein